MSHVRLAVGGVSMVAVLAGSSAVALAAWPLAVAQAPVESRTMHIQAAGSSIVTSRVDVTFPSGLGQQMTAAMLQLDAVVDANGAVTSARLGRVGAQKEKRGVASSDLRTLEAAMARSTAGPDAGEATEPVFADPAAVIRDLETLTRAAVDALQQWRFMPPQDAPAIARVSVVFDLTHSRATFGPAQAVSGFQAPATSTYTSAPPPRPSDGTLRVGGNIKPPQKIVTVPPVYPQEAQDARVQGVVILDVTIDPQGVPANVRVLRSIPMLDAAAIEAVQQWRYQPTLLNGAPVPITMTVTVNFTLSD